MIGIGIDTGGTYTDVVVYDMDTKEILCSGKALTTKKQLELGIAAALDTLDQEALRKAEMLALSTTLATNACVEDKGSRARLLMIGLKPEDMKDLDGICQSYGFRDPGQLTYLDAKPAGIYSEPKDPDWESYKERIREEFAGCDAVGVVQTYPGANGGKFEKQARKLLEEQLNIPITTAYDMFDEVSVLKRGAGTLLNARLIPIIEEFIQAVRNVMKARGLSLPIAIVRSDGSLMSEALAKECPVETMLSGPAASVVGGKTIVGDMQEAVIVDMGGTTTDVAIVQEGRPLLAKDGISIGPWRTMVKGLFVDTFLLGGDSCIQHKDGELFISTRRVIPLSVLAREYPQVCTKLKELADSETYNTRMIHEFYVLQKDISDNPGYTSYEQALCRALKDGPLTLRELMKAVKGDLYHPKADRLEEEGILLRSGLTPTDMMVLKGDFSLYDKTAARAAVKFVARHVKAAEEEIPETIYNLVEERLYKNIARILLQQKYPNKKNVVCREEMETFIDWNYQMAKYGAGDGLVKLGITTDYPLIGVGAPIHIFLPRVAKLLGTTAVIKEHAAVANALGAIASQIVSRAKVSIKPDYEMAEEPLYGVMDGEGRRYFKDYEEAKEYAGQLAIKAVREKALRQGASWDASVKVEFREVKLRELLLETYAEAVAVDAFQME